MPVTALKISKIWGLYVFLGAICNVVMGRDERFVIWISCSKSKLKWPKI